MILEASDLVVSFKKENQKSLFGRERQQVLKGVSLDLSPGECLGIIGESGSGKSTLGKVLCGLLKPEQGKINIEGIDLYSKLSKEEKKSLRHKISIVFQDYSSSVNPRFHVKDIIGESFRVAGSLSKDERKERVGELLCQVGLDPAFADRYPHQLSGGQLQRVCIARAVAVSPKVLLLDEAVSSLDAVSQVQVMDLLAKLRETYHFSYLFITHDLTSVTYLCDRALFMKDGEIVEQVDSMAGLSSLNTSYARKLLHCVLKPQSGGMVKAG